MTYRISPAHQARQRWHDLANKGHRWALVDSTGAIVMSSRDRRAMLFFLNFRADLKLVDVSTHL